MIQKSWVQERNKTLICLDSYRDGIPEGRIYGAHFGVDTFKSLSQFLIKMEELLEETQMPQSYTAKRSFSTITAPLECGTAAFQLRRGAAATFELQIIFRQHTSWQGTILWLEENLEQSFRSVLELILLMDSALRRVDIEEAS